MIRTRTHLSCRCAPILVVVSTAIVVLLLSSNALAASQTGAASSATSAQAVHWEPWANVAGTVLGWSRDSRVRLLGKTLKGIAKACDRGVLPRVICLKGASPHTQTWGVGVTFSANTPVFADNASRYYLPARQVLTLVCWQYGGVLTGPTGYSTGLYYRLGNFSGGYVNDAWIDTGTDYVVPGVPKC
jgi:hypothetical protein